MKILIIEDKKRHIEAAKKQLVGHELTIFTSFKEFLRNTEEGEPLSKYDAVLTDVELPSLIDNSPRDIAMAPTGLIIMTKALADSVKYVGVITDANHHMDAITRGFDFWLHSITPISLGQSKLFLMAGDACDYPWKDINPSKYENVSKEKMLNGGGAVPKYKGEEKNMKGWLTFKDPFYDAKKDDADDDSGYCKNWARLLRILTENYVPSDIPNDGSLMTKVMTTMFKN